jgi:ABC-type multidrug transport system ATPase subunit
MDGALDLESNQ